MNATQPTVYAFVSDITPSRATVEAISDDEQDLQADFEDRHDGEIIEVTDDTQVGDRVWLIRLCGQTSGTPHAPF